MSPRLRTVVRATPLLLFALLLALWALCAARRDDSLLGVLAAETPVVVFGALAVVALLASIAARSVAGGLATLGCALVAALPLGGWNLPSHSAAAHAEHRVLTCNVEQWSHDGAVVGRAFAELEPDVFCLQEAGSYDDIPGDPEWTAFSAALPGYQLLRHGEIAIGTRWPVLDQRAVALPEGPDTRPLLDVTLQAPSGEPLHVLSTHLVYTHYYGELPGSIVKAARGRRAQVQRVLEHLASLHGPSILCGDLNAAPNSVALSLLREQLVDAWHLRGLGFGATLPSNWPLRRIDYLLVRGIEIGDIHVLDRLLSDHRALSADFALSAGNRR